ncbi:LOB domain-containing protein 20 [Striga hermonthica]|uniref:LOB domain-containing protein 20 n=1 Tax=Striga hermonthica TaxID=68872 RepID=A0A9N7NUL5_STRHE|nr:LOB domain-containing protein 20 [Striga hermonthica]
MDDGTNRRGPAKLPGPDTPAGGAHAPCGACKFLRRKCVAGCIFAPHFGPDQGPARFAAVHRVFGASNVSKLLSRIPMGRRHDAVVTISYEAHARLSDPVHGCVSTIMGLQQQVTSLQAELSMVQTQLMNSRILMANALHTWPPPHHHHDVAAAGLQPAYSGTSSASNNNHFSVHSFGPNSLNETAFSNCFEPNIPHLLGRALHEEEEDESHDPVALANRIFL